MDLQDRLEFEAKLRAKTDEVRAKFSGKGMPPPKRTGAEILREAMVGTNAGMPGTAFRQRAPMYHVPGEYNAAGWTNKAGETFITDTADRDPGGHSTASVIGHETFHSAMRPHGMPIPKVMTATGLTRAELARIALAQNMERIQPDAGRPMYWGMRPNRDAEEQIANLRGYEAGLPAGTSITQSPLAEQLFQPLKNMVFGNEVPPSRQEIIDHYYGQSSLAAAHDPEGRAVGVGVWEGQAPESSTLQKAQATAKRIMTRLGINTERFNNPNE